jgi:hypothetical protein
MRSLVSLALIAGCVSSTEHPVEPPRTPAPAASVPADYAAGRDRVLALGREALAQLASDPAALHARFVDTFARQVSAEQVASTQAQLGVKAPAEREAVELRGELAFYDADVATTTGPGRVRVAFDRDGRIAAMSIKELPDVPAETAAPAPITLAPPFHGLWYVRWGGTTEIENYHVIAPAQRHAFDFVIWRDGAPYRTDGATAADYRCWDQPIVSPADGTVVEAVDGVADNTPPQMNPSQPFGNHVVIQVGGAYVVLAHLRQGSVAVATGDKVARGDAIGRCGNSGNTSEPHVHLHAQDRPALDDPQAVGVPIELVGVGAPTRGQFIDAR